MLPLSLRCPIEEDSVITENRQTVVVFLKTRLSTTCSHSGMSWQSKLYVGEYASPEEAVGVRFMLFFTASVPELFARFPMRRR